MLKIIDMAYSEQLANRVRKHLAQFPKLQIEEKKMFGGLAFMVNRKMCINISDDNLMCRFDPDLTSEVAKKTGFQPVVMKGKTYKGYCYVEPEGFKEQKDFECWINLCLDFNGRAKPSKNERITKSKYQ